MLVHSVFFWLRDDLSDDQVEAFRTGLESLKEISAADAVYVGTPASTAPRPVIDDSYSFALTVVVEDVATHDRYQVDPLHKAFVETFSSCWERVLIYDVE